MKDIIKDVGYCTEYMNEVDEIALRIDQKEFDKIKEAALLVQSGGYLYISMFAKDFDLLCDGEKSEYRHNGGEYRVFDRCVYFYCQNKDSAEVEFESEEITFEEIEEALKED